MTQHFLCVSNASLFFIREDEFGLVIYVHHRCFTTTVDISHYEETFLSFYLPSFIILNGEPGWDLNWVSSLNQLIEWQNEDWGQMFGPHGGSLQPSCHSVSGVSWCRGDHLKWLDWREKGTAALSKWCSDAAEQLACFHHRCSWSGANTACCHMNGYRNASGKLWGAWLPLFLPISRHESNSLC